MFMVIHKIVIYYQQPLLRYLLYLWYILRTTPYSYLSQFLLPSQIHTLADTVCRSVIYICSSVNHQSGLQSNTFMKLSFIFEYIKMCLKLCHYIWGIWFLSEKILKLWRQESWPLVPGWSARITRIRSWTFRLPCLQWKFKLWAEKV